MNPMTGRPLAIAETCICALAVMFFAPTPTGLEDEAMVIGVIAAMIFWLQCYWNSEVNHDQTVLLPPTDVHPDQ